MIGTFLFYWSEAPRLDGIETGEGFSLEDLLHALGRLEHTAVGCLKHSDRPTSQEEDGDVT